MNLINSRKPKSTLLLLISSTLFIQLFIATAIGVGWIKDIIKLSNCDFKEPYKAEVIYGVGAVIPFVGAVTGWMDFGK
jgi:hypothetical protein